MGKVKNEEILPKLKADNDDMNNSEKILINKNNYHEIIKNSNKNTQNKNKILTVNKPRKKLQLRADVMNKNFFMVLRREIKFILKNYLVSNRLSTSK